MSALQENLKYLYNNLVSNGLDKPLAAGITTNAYRECAGNPSVITIDGNPSVRSQLSKTPSKSHGIGGGYIGFYYNGELKNLFKYAQSNSGVLSNYANKTLTAINTEIESWLMVHNNGSIPANAFYDGGSHLRNSPYANKFVVSPQCQANYIAHLIKTKYSSYINHFTGDNAMHQAHNWFFTEVEKAKTPSVEVSWQRYGQRTKDIINDADIAGQLTDTPLTADNYSVDDSNYEGTVFSGTYTIDLNNVTQNNLLNLESTTKSDTKTDNRTIKRVYTYRPKNSQLVQLVPMELDYGNLLTTSTTKV